MWVGWIGEGRKIVRTRIATGKERIRLGKEREEGVRKGEALGEKRGEES